MTPFNVNPAIASQNDIVIGIRFDIEDLREKARKELDTLKKPIADLKFAMSKDALQFRIDKTQFKKDSDAIKARISELNKGINSGKESSIANQKQKELAITKQIATLEDKIARTRLDKRITKPETRKNLIDTDKREILNLKNKLSAVKESSRSVGTSDVEAQIEASRIKLAQLKADFDKKSLEFEKNSIKNKGELLTAQEKINKSTEIQHDLIEKIQNPKTNPKDRQALIDQLNPASLLHLKKQEMEAANNRLQKMLNNVRRNRIEFAGWAMSIMFFGMAMQKAFNSLWTMGKTTFVDIKNSIEDSTNGFTMLEGSIKYLGFNLGQALEPLAMALIPFIDRLSQIVLMNPKLTADIVKWGSILGGIFAVGGGGVLALNGFIDLGLKLGLVNAEAIKLGLFNWATLGKAIQGGIGLISIGFAALKTKDAFDSFKDGDLWNGIFSSMSAGLLAVGGYKLLRGKGGGWLVALGVAFDRASKGTLFEDFMSTFGILSALLNTVMRAIGHEMTQHFRTSVWEGIKSTMYDLATTGLLKLIPGADDLMKKVFAIDQSPKESFDFKNTFIEQALKARQMGRNWDSAVFGEIAYQQQLQDEKMMARARGNEMQQQLGTITNKDLMSDHFLQNQQPIIINIDGVEVANIMAKKYIDAGYW